MPGLRAGTSRTDINGASIGIELVNPGHEFGYRAFAEPQMAALEKPVASESWRAITCRRAMCWAIPTSRRSASRTRASYFDWPRLARAGIGLWPDFPRAAEPPETIAAVQATLAALRLCLPALGRLDAETTGGDLGVPAPFPAGALRRRRRSRDPPAPRIGAGRRRAGSFDRSPRRSPYMGRQTAGWPRFPHGRGEESPGSTETRCRITSGGGDPRESATETHRLTGPQGRRGKGEMVR